MVSMAGYVSETEALAINIFMLTVTMTVVLLRLGLSIWSTRKLDWDDAWLMLAAATYITCPVLYICVMKRFYRVLDVAVDPTTFYPTFIEDLHVVKLAIYLGMLLFQMVLWFCKYALLAYYKQLLTRLTWYMRIWWFTTVVCGLVGRRRPICPLSNR